MKKSMKKACMVALLTTSTLAAAGVNAVVMPNSYEIPNKTVYAKQNANTLTMLEVDGQNATALVGSTYTVPTARLVVNGAEPTVLDQTNYTVISPIGENVEVVEGKFEIKRIGNYTINYKIENGEKEYTATVTVNGQVGVNTINIVENTKRTLPKYVWQSYKGEIYIPQAEVEFSDEEVETEYTITTTITTPSQKTLTFNAETGLLNFDSLEEGTYSVRFDAKTSEGVYLNTRTEEFTVLSDTQFEKEYGKDYELKFEYSKTVNTSADIGEEIELPTPIGKMGAETTPVYYTIEAYVYINGKTVDVTSQTINGNKFTAQKTYVIDGQTYTVDNGRYLFYYNVTDALGKKAEKTGFEISGVKDTKAPEVIVADPYTVDNTENIKNVDYKLQTNFTNGKNIVLKAIYAKDLSDSLSDMELVRYIRSTSQSSSSDDIYTDAGKEDKSIFTKDIVFNRTDDFAFDAETMVDAKDLGIDKLEDGSYTAYYKAKDSAGNTVTLNYSFTVDSSFEFTTAPTVEFKDTFSKSVSTGEKITFNKPVASDENDDRLYTQVMYKYDNDANWTVLEANEDGKYEIVVDKDGATSLKIRAKTENDARLTAEETNADNNIEAYKGFKYGYDEVEILIKDNKDTSRPKITSLSDWAGPYEQNDEVVLPTLTLTDDLVDYVDVNITVTHIENVEGETKTQDFDVENAVIMRSSSTGTYTLSGAKFYATLAGDYNVVYEITDAGNNKTYIYQTVNVAEKAVVDEPRFSNLPEALSDGKLELGESITLPVPEITGAGDNATYEVNVIGPVGSQLNKETFTPKKTGTYTIIYSLYVNDEEVESERKEFKVEVTDTTNPDVRVEWNLNDSYEVGSKVLIPVFSANDISGIDLDASKIVISSKSYTRTIKGSEMADLLNQYGLWLEEEQQIAEGTLLPEDREHPNAGNLYVTLNYNEQYTVTYTVYDKSTNKNSTVVTHTIKVGDLVKPVVDVKDDIVSSTVKIDTILSIDLSKITVEDNKTQGMSANDIKIVVKNTTTGVEVKNIHEDEDNGKFEYSIETAGEYSITFSATDDAGNTATVTRTFTVNEPGNDGVTTNEIITIVLCCVAVLVLAGSIVYMVVSKKKMQSYK